MIEDETLIALQGPRAHEVLQPLVQFDLSKFPFMHNRQGSIAGIAKCTIVRCGYTGEDGFELSIPSKHVVPFVEELLKHELVAVSRTNLYSFSASRFNDIFHP